MNKPHPAQPPSLSGQGMSLLGNSPTILESLPHTLTWHTRVYDDTHTHRPTNTCMHTHTQNVYVLHLHINCFCFVLRSRIIGHKTTFLMGLSNWHREKQTMINTSTTEVREQLLFKRPANILAIITVCPWSDQSYFITAVCLEMPLIPV